MSIQVEIKHKNVGYTRRLLVESVQTDSLNETVTKSQILSGGDLAEFLVFDNAASRQTIRIREVETFRLPKVEPMKNEHGEFVQHVVVRSANGANLPVGAVAAWNVSMESVKSTLFASRTVMMPLDGRELVTTDYPELAAMLGDDADGWFKRVWTPKAAPEPPAAA